ncbi:Ig-like domain-containing protein [Escherichia coli]|nr:Ig-like domain-containing protein [Escherichia coli]
MTWTYLDGRTLTDGNYNYQVRVIDTAGNIGATASQIVTVDTNRAAGRAKPSPLRALAMTPG